MQGRSVWHGLLAFGCLVSAPAFAKGARSWSASGDQSTLNAISERAKYLARAEQLRTKAAGETSLTKRPLAAGESTHYVTHKEKDTWYAVFGTLTKERDAFVVERAFMVPAERPNIMNPIEESALPFDPLPFARMEAIAVQNLKSEMYARYQKHPREPLIVKVDEGFVAYVMPRESSDQPALYGGDFKVNFASDGTSIVAVQELHTALHSFDFKKCPKTGCLGATHRHESDTPPTETDIANTMRHPQLAPHFVTSAKRIFQIDANGAVRRVASLTEGQFVLEGTVSSGSASVKSGGATTTSAKPQRR
jgi:hypothetical protein